jgi:hypothetical protein
VVVGLGRLELEDDADEALGQGVVDVAGQARANRRPKTTETRPPATAGRFSDRRRYWKIWGYRTSSREK